MQAPAGMTLLPALPAVPLFLVAASIFILGVAVMARDRASAPSLAFLSLTGSVSIWLFSIAFMMMSGDERTAMFFAKLAYIGVALIPAAVFHFTVALLDQTHERRGALLG